METVTSTAVLPTFSGDNHVSALFLSVIIPAYNEETRLPLYLKQVMEFLELQPFSSEVIVVDDGSGDGTVAIVREFMQRYPRLRLEELPRNCGKGYAVKRGMAVARGKRFMFADADGATPIGELRRLLDAVEAGADIAIGSRAMKSDQCVVKGRAHRKIMGTVFNGLIRVLAIKGIHDTQCGFKLFTVSAAHRIFPLQRVKGFGFDVEILFLARRSGFRIAEVPVNWADVKGSKVRLVRDSFKMFCDVLKIRLYDVAGVYSR